MGKKKVSRLLLVLAEYFGFAILCGFVSYLFFSWASDVISYNYVEHTGTPVDLASWYLLKLLAFVPGILIFVFVLVVLIQKKFAYMLEISRAVEEMEAGNLDRRIILQGDDELTDLAASINCFAEAVQEEQALSEALKEERFHTIAVLSHDLRTPLTAVMSYLQLICDEKITDPDQLKEYAGKAYEKACRIRDMTDDLFENCRKPEEVQLTEVDGQMFVRQIIWDLQTYLEDLSFRTEVKLPEEKEAFSLKVEKERIPRVLDNLLSNIEKYGDREEVVLLEAEVRENSLFLRQSNGIDRSRDVQSSLLGLKSMDQTVRLSGGSCRTREENGRFVLEISLPLLQK